MRYIALVFVLLAINTEAGTIDKKFLLVNGFYIGSAILDVESTFYSLDRCSNCVEGNPVVAPFVNKGKLTTYAFYGAVTTGVIYGSYILKKRRFKYWWTPIILGTVVHFLASRNDFQLAWKVDL